MKRRIAAESAWAMQCAGRAIAVAAARLLRRTATATLVVLGLCAGTAQAQVACPVEAVSGSGQKLAPGVPSAPLVFRQTGNFAAVPPTGVVSFNLAIVGNAVFSSTGSQSLTLSAPWALLAGTTYAATVNTVRVVAGSTGGPITVSVQSQNCSAIAQPAIFNLFGAGGNFGPRIIAVAGNRTTIRPGGSVRLVAAVDFGPAAVERAPQGIDSLTFAVVSGDATFAGGGRSITVPIVGDANEASATLVAGASEGTVAVEARAPTLQPASFAITVRRGQTLSIVSGDGQTGPPGASGQPLVVEVRDPNGAPQPGVALTWSLPSGSGPVLAQTFTRTDASGRSSNTFLFASALGASNVLASLDDGTAVRFTLTSALGGLAVAQGDAQRGAAGSDADAPIVFNVVDPSGRPAVGERVDFSVDLGDAVLLNDSDVVSSAGTARVRFRFGATPGTIRIRASILGGRFSATATATAFAATGIVVSGNNQSAPVGGRLPQPLVVQLGQPPVGGKGLGGVTIAWSVTAGGGRLETATSLTDADGRASNQWTLGPAAGNNAVRAEIPGGGSVAFVATATPLVPANVSFEIAAGNNQSLPTGAPSAPLVVRVRSAAGAPVPGATVAWRVTPAGNGSANPSSSVTNAQGEASTIVTLGLPGPTGVVATLPDSPATPALNFSLNGGVANISGLNEGQREVANAIDAACPALFRASQAGALDSGQQDLLARCSELVGNAGNSPADVTRALNQMLNEETAAQDDAAFNTAGAQFDNLKARIAALRSGAAGINLGGLALAGGGGVLPLSFLPSNLVAGEGEAGGEVGADFSRWGFFASGTIGRGERDAASSTPGYEFDTYGLTAGVDYRWSDRLVFGAALGYNNNDTDVDLDQGRLETKGYSGSLYATWYHGDSWFADAVFTYGRNSYDLSRRIRYQIRGAGGAMQTVDQSASASPDGNQTQFALSAGRDFSRGAWSFGPYARATMTRIDFDGYTERMSNPGSAGSGLALAVGERELESLEGVLGGKVSYTMSTSWGVLVPHAQVEYLHEFEDDPDDIVARFANDPTGTTIRVPQAAVDTGYFNLGLGLSGVFANGRSAFLYYERRAGQSGYSQDSLALGVRIEF